MLPVRERPLLHLRHVVEARETHLRIRKGTADFRGKR